MSGTPLSSDIAQALATPFVFKEYGLVCYGGSMIALSLILGLLLLQVGPYAGAPNVVLPKTAEKILFSALPNYERHCLGLDLSGTREHQIASISSLPFGTARRTAAWWRAITQSTNIPVTSGVLPVVAMNFQLLLRESSR